jgi:TusE/DsrC/DsvC family sulfur relay protein
MSRAESTNPSSETENNWEEFLVPLSNWDRKVAEELARRNDVWPLTQEHWKVIEYVRGYYLKFSQGPAIIKVSQATGLSMRRICELFPCGMVRGAYRIAGLPRPPGCA